MKILMVQPVYDAKFTLRSLIAKIERILIQQEVDLVVFPESFYQSATRNAAMKFMKKMAERLQVAVMSGVSLADGSEWAFYYNPKPQLNETTQTAFLKHSTAAKIAFDYDMAIRADIYDPIYLQGHRIQSIISHDLFFPLVVNRLEQEGMDLLIHLTEGNVRMSKWHNILKGRSYETDALILCTMGHDPNQTQTSDIIAYRKGVRIIPEYMTGDSYDHEDACHLFDMSCLEYIPEATDVFYSTKRYEQFTFGKDEKADVYFDSRRKRLKTTLTKVQEYDNSFIVEKNGEHIHIHFATYDSLKKRIYVYDQPSHINEHQVIVYFVNKEVNEEEAIALLKLRVIENRIAAILITKNLFLGAKTTRYKNIQLFKPENAIVGFDLAFMHGIDSVFQRTNRKLGIPYKYKQAYIALHKDYNTQ